MPIPLGLPWQIAIGTNGLPLPAARLYAYRAGSTILQAVYADPALQTALPNPVVADAYGAFPPIYLDDRGPNYKLVLTDRDGAIVPGRQADNIAAAGSGGGGGGGNGQDGVNAFYLVLSRQTTTVPADSSGIVSSFASANGLLRAYNGGLDVTADCALAVTAQVNCTGTINTAANSPVNGQPLGYYQVTAMTADVAELRFTVTYGTRTADAVFTLVKAKQGNQGTPGAPGGGANSITLQLSRDSAMALAYADGTVISYAGIDGLARMYDGTTEVTASTTWSATTSNGVATINTAADTPVTGQPRGYFRVTSMSADTATVTVQGTYNSVTYNRVFTVTKLKGGYEIVGALPTTNLFVGRLVFLTTDSKLYRYTGSAWTAAVPAVDITGLLADAQLAGIAATKVNGLLTSDQIQSIAAAKLTGQITSTQVADGAISTPKLAAGSVTAAQIAAGTITGDQIAAQTITGNKISALTITGDKIAAGTIAGDRILANSISADRLAVGSVTTDKIAAGAVTAAQINVTQLSALSANLGTVTAGLIRDPSTRTRFDVANGTILFNNGTHMLAMGPGFGTSSQFYLWGGPTQASLASCSEANAVLYMTLDGTVGARLVLLTGSTLPPAASFTASIPGGLFPNVPNGAQTYGSLVVTPSGGRSPYTYLWNVIPQDDVSSTISITSGVATNTATFSGRSTNNSINAYASCTVTDADGRVAVAGAQILAVHGTP